MLRQLILSKNLEALNKEIDVHRDAKLLLITRREELSKNEAELVSAVNEVNESTSPDDKAVIEALVTEHEEAAKQLEEDELEYETKSTVLNDKFASIKNELDEINNRTTILSNNKKGEDNTMSDYTRVRNKFGSELTEIIKRDSVRKFITRLREMKGQQRAMHGGALLIPDEMLDLLRDNMNRYSKLIKYVNLRTVSGKARQLIAGTIPEGVWTEACASLNELEFRFSQVEVDGYKVGGFIPVCNAILADSDINLSSEIMDMLGQAIGFAIDKAILYGTGIKMPQGIVTRMAQKTKPADWPDDAPEWVDLSTSHIFKLLASAFQGNELFFGAMVQFLGVARSDYAGNQTRFWAMNETTWNSILGMTVAYNSSGALVASTQKTMPVIGGNIETFDFIPDGDIIGGYGSLYLLAERSGAEMAVSEHVRFLDDQTIFKGTARYDGLPVIGEGFVVVNIANRDPATSITFAPDTANMLPPPMILPPQGEYTAPVGVYLISDKATAHIKYTIDGTDPTETTGVDYTGNPLQLTESTTVKAIALAPGADPSPVSTATYTVA